MKPKIKIISIDKKEIKLNDDKLIHTIMTQNGIHIVNDEFSM